MKREKIKLYILCTIVFSIFPVSYLYRRNRDNDIQAHSKYTIGKMVRFSSTLKSGDYWNYKFKYNDTIYNSSRPTHVNYTLHKGDYFVLNFSSKDPEHNHIMYEYELNNKNQDYMNSIWDTIPYSIFHSAKTNDRFW